MSPLFIGPKSALLPLFIFTFVLFLLVRTEQAEVDLAQENGGENGEGQRPEEENGVIVLGDDTFDTFLEKNPTMLVEFYAPWSVNSDRKHFRMDSKIRNRNLTVNLMWDQPGLCSKNSISMMRKII